jgi:hypothetical protein
MVSAGQAGSFLTENGKLGTENCYEGTGIGKENLRQVQDHPPQGRGAGDLRQHQTQTAPGMNGAAGFQRLAFRQKAKRRG